MIYINTHVLVASRRCKKMPYPFLLLHMEVVCPHSVTLLAGFGLVSMDSIWSYILNENLKLIRSGWLAVGRPSPANGGRLLAHKVLSLLCGQANLRTKKEQTENMIRTQCTTKYIRFHICNSCWYENIFTIEVRTYIYIYQIKFKCHLYYFPQGLKYHYDNIFAFGGMSPHNLLSIDVLLICYSDNIV